MTPTYTPLPPRIDQRCPHATIAERAWAFARVIPTQAQPQRVVS